MGSEVDNRQNRETMAPSPGREGGCCPVYAGLSWEPTQQHFPAPPTATSGVLQCMIIYTFNCCAARVELQGVAGTFCRFGGVSKEGTGGEQICLSLREDIFLLSSVWATDLGSYWQFLALL